MNKKERLAKGLLKLGELAEKSGLTQGTIRHYANMGLIHTDETTVGGFRLFNENKAIEDISYIKKLISQGKTLEQIRDMDFSKRPAKEILVVDDDVEVSDLIKDLLKDRIDANIKVAFDGFLAGKLLGEYVPELIILDLHLPGIDGFKVCENTRNDPQYVRTKILAITGYGSEETEQRILSSGANAYITKPFDAKELFSLICKLLNISEK